MPTRDNAGISRSGQSGSLWREYRSRAGLTQESLARKAGVTDRTIRDLESGRRNPSAATFRRVAAALGLSQDEIELLRGPVPRRLPPAPRCFIGRADTVSAISEATAPTRLITGPGGIGKTWLMLHWAHQHGGAFTDGQVYLNLRGFEPDRPPLNTAEALRDLLAALGIDAAVIPRETANRARMLQERLSGKRILLLFDDAHSTQQIRPLLCGAPGVAIVTSRNALSGLDADIDISRLRLDAFDTAETLESLTRRLGRDRVAAEPGAARQLASACVGLPLAVSLLAARGMVNPSFPLSALADELSDRESRLDILTTDEQTTSLRSVVATSFARLGGTAARIAALLGLAPAPGISVSAIASLAGIAEDELSPVLTELVEANLIDRVGDNRIAMHDMIHLYAAEQAKTVLTTSEQAHASARLVDHYLHTGHSADQWLAAEYQWRDLGGPVKSCRPSPIPDETVALKWFTTEHSNILDAQRIAECHGWHDRVWKLAWVLRTFHRWQTLLDDDVAVWTKGLSGAHATGDATTQAIAEYHLGAALMNLERESEAEPHLERSLRLARETGDLQVQCGVHYVRSLVAQNRDDWHSCLEHSNAVLAAARALGQPARLAEALNGVGWSLAHLDRHVEARAACDEAVAILDGTSNVEDLADAWDSLGYISAREGNHRGAIDPYRHALERYERLNPDSYHVARVHECLGDAFAALEKRREAREHWQEAKRIQTNHYRPDLATAIEDKLIAL